MDVPSTAGAMCVSPTVHQAVEHTCFSSDLLRQHAVCLSPAALSEASLASHRPKLMARGQLAGWPFPGEQAELDTFECDT